MPHSTHCGGGNDPSHACTARCKRASLLCRPTSACGEGQPDPSGAPEPPLKAPSRKVKAAAASPAQCPMPPGQCPGACKASMTQLSAQVVFIDLTKDDVIKAEPESRPGQAASASDGAGPASPGRQSTMDSGGQAPEPSPRTPSSAPDRSQTPLQSPDGPTPCGQPSPQPLPSMLHSMQGTPPQVAPARGLPSLGSTPPSALPSGPGQAASGGPDLFQPQPPAVSPMAPQQAFAADHHPYGYQAALPFPGPTFPMYPPQPPYPMPGQYVWGPGPPPVHPGAPQQGQPEGQPAQGSSGGETQPSPFQSGGSVQPMPSSRPLPGPWGYMGGQGPAYSAFAPGTPQQQQLLYPFSLPYPYAGQPLAYAPRLGMPAPPTAWYSAAPPAELPSVHQAHTLRLHDVTQALPGGAPQPHSNSQPPGSRSSAAEDLESA